MSLFIFPHDERATLSGADVRAWLLGRSDASDVRAGDGEFSELTWSAEREGVAFDCNLTVDRKAVWADYDVAAACEHLADLAASIGIQMDLSDDQYSAHVHLHDRSGEDSPWSELMRGWSDPDGGS